MLLTDLVAPNAVIPALRVNSKKQILQELAAKAAELCGQNERTILEVLQQREKLGSTGVGHGIAIPHARIAGTDRPIVLVLRTKRPIAFGAPDQQPVSVLLVILVPEHAQEEHLQILAAAAQLFSDPAFRERLDAATEPGVIGPLFGDPSAAQPELAGRR